VTKRSWLDAGTEVLPGERKFTDYAFRRRSGNHRSGRENLTARSTASATRRRHGGYPQRFPLYD